MADFTAAYGDMENISNRLKTAKEEISDQLKDLKSGVDDLTESGFKTQVASGKFAQGYGELTTNLTQALESISEMGEGLNQMKQKIQDLDSQM